MPFGFPSEQAFSFAGILIEGGNGFACRVHAVEHCRNLVTLAHNANQVVAVDITARPSQLAGRIDRDGIKTLLSALHGPLVVRLAGSTPIQKAPSRRSAVASWCDRMAEREWPAPAPKNITEP